MERTDELQLIKRLKEGDEEAFNSIYEHYKPELEEFLLRRGTCREDVDDMLQEVFTSLWTKRNELDVTNSLLGYLIGAVRFQRINSFSKNKKITERHVIYEQLQEAKTLDAQAKQELCDWLMSELDLAADEEERTAFRGVYEKGEKPKEVAAELGIKAHRVKHILFKWRKFLRTLINKQQ